MTRSILIIDDEPNMRWVLGRALEQAGYTVHSAESGEEALSIVGRTPIDLVLLDLKLRGEDGLTILRRLRTRHPDLVVIMLTAYGSVPHAVEAMQLGAADFLRKPFDVEEVTFKIARALERRAMREELTRLTATQRSALAFETLAGTDMTWQHLVAQARQVAATNHDLMLLGEAGSGRTSLARAIHVAGMRQAAPLVELDLTVYHGPAQAAVLFGSDRNGGAWAEAGCGSLLLTGLSEAVSIHDQLADYLEQRPAHNRPRLLLVATEEQLVPDRIAACIPVRLRVPALRERRSDVLLLAASFVAERPIIPLAAQALEQYPWPGNVTELRATIERAAQLAGTDPIDLMHLPDRIQALLESASQSPFRLPPEGVNLEQVEQALIRQALERARGNKSKAAELLGLTRHTLLYRMDKYGITAPEQP